MTIMRHAFGSPAAQPSPEKTRGWRLVAVWLAAVLGSWALIGGIAYGVMRLGLWISRGFT